MEEDDSQPTPSREQSQACLAMPRREGGRRSQPTDNKWTYWESQHERYCQIWVNGLNNDVKTE